ncbi:MAG: acyl carrier protein [Bacteroidales bacterium]|nr:acyl carrier protein [Bacteroidales bacterium]
MLRDDIKEMLEDALPLVDFESKFLFSELDSLGVTTILMMLSDKYGIELDGRDATPKNLKSLDNIVAMVERKQSEK